MKGNNEMKFNQATMIEAVEYYLEKIMVAPAPKVREITAAGYDSYSEFVIKIKSDEGEA